MKSLLVALTGMLFFVSVCNGFSGEEKVQKQKILILLGAPGSGKGTQAEMVQEKLQIPHISTGDLFRENIRKNTEVGKQAKAFTDAGKLVPDEIVLKMLFERLSQPDCQSGYLLDGFPRTLSQAEALDKELGPSSNLIVVNLDVSEETVIKRLSGRRICLECNRVYNIYFSPPKKENICDKCDGKLIQRPDDRPEVVKERLKVYHEQTEPLIEYYEKRGILKNIDGEKGADLILQDILEQLKEKDKEEI